MRFTATFDFAAAPLLERLIVRVRATRATAAPAARVGGIAEGHGLCAQAAASKDAGSAREKVRVQSGSEVTLRYPCCLPPRLLAAVVPPLLRPPPLAWSGAHEPCPA